MGSLGGSAKSGVPQGAELVVVLGSTDAEDRFGTATPPVPHARLLATPAHQGLARRFHWPAADGKWVFTAPRSRRYPRGDHPVNERRLLEYLKRALKKLGLKGHLQTFRHSFISHALTQGIPEAVVRQSVGHVDPEVIKVYMHILDPASQAAMQRLAEANNPQIAQKGKEARDGSTETSSDQAQTKHNPKEGRNGSGAKEEPSTT